MKRILLSILVIGIILLAACGETTTAPAPAPAPAQIPITTPAPAPTDKPTSAPVTESVWEVIIDSVKSEASLYMEVPVPQGRETIEFYLEDPNSIFLLVSFSLRPKTKDNTVDMQEIIVTHSKSGHFYPIGLYIGKPNSDWKICTSGSCHLEVLSDKEVTVDYDLYYEADNDYGIKNDDLVSHNESATTTVTLFQPPMFTFAYAIPHESISGGQLWLELPSSQPVELVITQ